MKHGLSMSLRIGASLVGLVVVASVATADPLSLLEFTGNDSFVTISHDEALDLENSTPFTVEGWVYLNDVSGNNMLYTKVRIMGPPNRDANSFRYSFGIRSGGTKLSAYTGSSWVETTVSIVADQWYHLAFAFNGSQLKYYTNGVLVDTQAYNIDSETQTYPFFIGGNDDTEDIDGYVRDVRVWDHERSQAQIQDNMLTVLDGSESGLVAAWRLDEGSGGTVSDISPNGFDGEIRSYADRWTAYDGNWRNFAVADMVTGSEEFTNSNEVDVVRIPAPPGYTHYEITESSDPSDLTGAWTPLTSVQDTAAFTQPGSDGTNALYAWVTNLNETVAATCGVANIVYTTVKPSASIVSALTRQTAGFTVRVWEDDLDAGSSGGLFGGTDPIGIAWMEAVCRDNPADDGTPGEPYVTLDGADTYYVALKVVNNAGNVVTSATDCAVTVAAASGPPSDGDRYVAVGNLHAAEPYTTWTTAANSIQNAINAADTGDVIRVWGNRYRVPTNAVTGNGAVNIVNVDEAVTLRAAGPREVVIEGRGSNRGVRVAFNYADEPFIMDGFVVSNCAATDGGGVYSGNNSTTSRYLNCQFIGNVAKGQKDSAGGGMYSAGDVIMSDCVFYNNRVESPGEGGGFYKAGGTLHLMDSLFETNTANYTTYQRGGGLTLNGGAHIVERTRFIRNLAATTGNAGSGGGAITFNQDNSSLLLRNCLFTGNNAANNAGSVLRTSRNDNQTLTIENCTVTGNGYNRPTFSLYNGSGTFSVYNSIFYNNDSYDFMTIPGDWLPAVFSNNVVESFQTPGDVPDFDANNNISVDPEFLDAAAGNYRLPKTSPCVDQGINQLWMNAGKDLEGRPRLDGQARTVDMGCYEYHYLGTMICIQ